EDTLIRTPRQSPCRFAAILSAEFAAQGFLALELCALLVSLHQPCAIGRAALMEGVMKFINAGAFFVPGQLGVAEGSYAVIFSTFGMPAVAGVTLSFVRRVRTFVTALVGVAMFRTFRRHGRPRTAGVSTASPDFARRLSVR